jgi:hypothetical protein
MSDNSPHSRKCMWGCLLSDMETPRANGFVAYLIEQNMVYCRCLSRNMKAGEICPIFPSMDFDLGEVEERYREHARG